MAWKHDAGEQSSVRFDGGFFCPDREDVPARRVARTPYHLLAPFIRHRLRGHRLTCERKFYGEIYD